MRINKVKLSELKNQLFYFFALITPATGKHVYAYLVYFRNLLLTMLFSLY